jgi:hypothetical protein
MEIIKIRKIEKNAIPIIHVNQFQLLIFEQRESSELRYLMEFHGSSQISIYSRLVLNIFFASIS